MVKMVSPNHENTIRTTNNQRDRIAQIAIKIFLREGVARTSMRDLAKATGLTTGGLYHYFNSKKEIISLVVENGIRSVDELKRYHDKIGNLSPTEVLRRCIEYWIRRGDQNQDYLIFYNREVMEIDPSQLQSIMQAVRDVVQFFDDLLVIGIRAGEFELRDTTLVSFNIWALENEWALRRWLLRSLLTIDEYAETQAEGIIKQISAGNAKVGDHRVTTASVSSSVLKRRSDEYHNTENFRAGL
jgi:AcrR family transcriptional regulator